MTKTVFNFPKRPAFLDSIKRIESLLTKDGSKIFYDKKMADYTTFKIGGSADAFLEVYTSGAMIAAINEARANEIPYFMLGGGSNLLVGDGGVPGIVIKNRIKKIELIEKDSEHAGTIERAGISMTPGRDVFVSFGSGIKLSEIIEFACENGFSGAEFLAGIPGTLGGAIFGNAGAYGKSVGDILLLAEIMTPEGKIRMAGSDYFDFSYRKSKLKTTADVVVSAIIKFTAGDKLIVRDRVEKIIAERHGKHPPETMGSAGSYFKNVSPMDPAHRRIAAGYFLEQAGVKGLKCGNAEVYLKHANFIVNPGGASAKEVLDLAKMMKVAVLEKFGLLLEEEVQYLA